MSTDSPPGDDQENRISFIVRRANALVNEFPDSVLGDVLNGKMRAVCTLISKEISPDSPKEHYFSAALRAAATDPSLFMRPLPQIETFNGNEKLLFGNRGQVPPPTRRPKK